MENHAENIPVKRDGEIITPAMIEAGRQALDSGALSSGRGGLSDETIDCALADIYQAMHLAKNWTA